MTPPLVSVLVPCYNAERWVGAALESVLTQTWPAVEVILVDDGSTDGSLTVAKRYAPRGVRVEAQDNRGAAAARNTALRLAKGDYIQYLDADDLLAPDKIESQVTTLADRPRGNVAAGRWARFQDDPSTAVFGPYPNARDLSGVELLQINFEEGCMMHPAAWLLPRAVADRAGDWNESLSLNDDGEYFARVALAADAIHFCSNARSYYRSSVSGSLSGRKDASALASQYRSTELIAEHLMKRDASSRTRAALAFGWKSAAVELYPGAPDLSRLAEEHSKALGGSPKPVPMGGRMRLASQVVGWRMAKRLLG
jgi:glycosyltransferase involved in cell wall biosynthesis